MVEEIDFITAHMIKLAMHIETTRVGLKLSGQSTPDVLIVVNHQVLFLRSYSKNLQIVYQNRVVGNVPKSMCMDLHHYKIM